MSEHLKTLTGNETDPNKIRDAAKAVKEHVPQMKLKNRDELRTLRSSVKKHLKEQKQQDTKEALTDLETTLEEHKIEEPLLPTDSGKKAAEVMPDILKPATETTVDAGNEALQRGYEEGKAIVKKVEKTEVYQEGKKRVEGFLEEAKEKGTIPAVRDRMKDMWENGGTGGKILVGTGLLAAGYLTYKAVSWLWDKLANGSKLAWGAIVAGLATYGGYKYYKHKEAQAKTEADEKDKADKAGAKTVEERLKMDKLSSVDFHDERIKNTNLLHLTTPVKFYFGVESVNVQFSKEKKHIVIDGKPYSIKGSVKLDTMLKKATAKGIATAYPDQVKLDAKGEYAEADLFSVLQKATTYEGGALRGPMLKLEGGIGPMVGNGFIDQEQLAASFIRAKKDGNRSQGNLEVWSDLDAKGAKPKKASLDYVFEEVKTAS